METGAFDQTTNRPRRSEKTRGRRHPCRVSGGRPPPRERKSLLLCSSLSRLSCPFPGHPTGRLLSASVASRDRTARRCRMRQDGSANTTETKEEWPLSGREMQRWMTGGARKAAPGCSTFQLGRQRTFCVESRFVMLLVDLFRVRCRCILKRRRRSACPSNLFARLLCRYVMTNVKRERELFAKRTCSIRSSLAFYI